MNVAMVTGFKPFDVTGHTVLAVDAAGQAEFKTIGEAVDRAAELLRAGKPVTIRIAPGNYREGEITIDGRKIGGQAIDTPLVIEAAQPGTVVWSGSSEFPAGQWKPIKNEQGDVVVYEREWPHRFGFNPGGWRQFNPKQPYEHRSELAFVNDQPLRQIMLELYEYTPVKADAKDFEASQNFADGTATDPTPGIPQNVNFHGVYKFIGQTDPLTMPPGSFGVTEREGTGGKIYLRPPQGVRFESAKIEVSTKRHLLWSHYKSNVVVRGITFQHAASPLEARKSVMFGHWVAPQERLTNNNILIEDCTFRNNNGIQLELQHGQEITLRRVKVLYGAYGGLSTSMLRNVVWEDVESSFNNWRVQGGWASGAAKIHNTLDMLIKNYTAIGNDSTGLWFDISCGNVLVDGAVSLGNTQGIDWEISRGLTVRNSVLSGNTKADFAIVSGSETTVDSSIIGGPTGVGTFIFQASERASGENIKKLLKLPVIEKYFLDRLVLTNNAIFVLPQPPAKTPARSHDGGVTETGYVAPLFLQHHGSPDLFARFVDDGIRARGNVWFSPRTDAFGVRKIYDGKDWRSRPAVNEQVAFAQWTERTGERDSTWKDPGFVAPEQYDFTLRPDSPLRGRGWPSFKLSDERTREWEQFKSAAFRKSDRRSSVSDVIFTDN